MSSIQETFFRVHSPVELQAAFALIEQRVLDGLKHGFFTLSIDAEIESGGRRAVTIRCGTSHRFIIRKEDLPE